MKKFIEKYNHIINPLVPNYALEALRILNDSGFEAWILGGFVRDILITIINSSCNSSKYNTYQKINKEIYYDIDITTNANCNQIKKIFLQNNWTTFDLGIKFGTVAVLAPKNYNSYNEKVKQIEITTYRTENSYKDGRHPSTIGFSNSIKEDIKRRDFTINAIAYHPKHGLYDPYFGINDIKQREIKTVGNPELRFKEDYLRIIRALRIAAQTNFTIEKESKIEIFKQAKNLSLISVERIREELNKLLCGKYAFNILKEYKNVIFEIIPDLKKLDGFNQKTKYHCYDIYTHTLVCLDKMPIDKYKTFLSKEENKMFNIIGKWAALLHDIGKPSTFTIDDKNQGHFYGHPKESAKIANKILNYFKFSKLQSQAIYLLVCWHDYPMETTLKSVKKRLNKFSQISSNLDIYWFFKLYCDLRRADSYAHAPKYRENYSITDKIEQIAESIFNSKDVFTLKQLKINGNDLINSGFKPGPIIGNVLNKCLNQVIDEKINNNKLELINYAKKITNCK